MKAICLPQKDRSSCCTLPDGLFSCNLIFWMIFFREEPIFASSISKFGIRCPRIDCDDFRSSTESTISTSLIKRIASEGWLEQEHASVLKLVFQNCNDKKRWEVIEMHLRDLILRVFNHRILWISPFCNRERENSLVETFSLFPVSSILASPRDIQKDDWERGITHSCLLSQDHGNLWNPSRKSLYLVIPELEP